MARDRRAEAAGGDGVARADEPRVCAHCGDRIDTSEWHPVETADEDGTFRLYAFCSTDCRHDWDG